MSVEDKIDILLYVFGAFFFLFAFLVAINIKRALLPKVLDRLTQRINDWDSKGENDLILQNVDNYIERFPGECSFQWSKARALFKSGEYEDSRTLFLKLAESEPLWKEDAEKYISSIDDKSSL
jgi:hypothetical protein